MSFSDRSFSANPHDAALLQTASVVLSGWTPAGPVTLFANEVLSHPWRPWSAKIFVPLIVPVLSDVLAATTSGQWKALPELARRFDNELPPEVAGSSAFAGCSFAKAFSRDSKDRPWKRCLEAIDAGEWPPHLAILMAVRAANFHIPHRAITALYLLLEARGLEVSGRGVDEANMLGECLAACPAPSFGLRAA